MDTRTKNPFMDMVKEINHIYDNTSVETREYLEALFKSPHISETLYYIS